MPEDMKTAREIVIPAGTRGKGPFHRRLPAPGDGALHSSVEKTQSKT